MSQGSSNFSDPVGLVLRMLASGHRAAYGALFREGLRIGVKPLDLLLNMLERRRTKSPSKSETPLVLIVGAPRSGTTLIYQALAHYLDVSFPTNFSAMFPQSPLTSALLQRRWSSNNIPDFRNFYGQTTRMGGVNDAFSIWDRWLGDDRYFPVQSLSVDKADEMQTFFTAWTAAFRKPFLNKNNRNALSMDLLAKHLPNARFIVVRRNPMYVAQSLIIARQRVQGAKSRGWGLQSSSTDETTDPLAYVDDVCRQITSIDEQMEKQLVTVAGERVVHLTYESFCENPRHWISHVAQAFDGLDVNPRAALDDLQPFDVSQRLTISPEEQARIRECLGQHKTAVTCPAASEAFSEDSDCRTDSVP